MKKMEICALGVTWRVWRVGDWQICFSAWQINRAGSIYERNILLFLPWRLVSPVSLQPSSWLPAGFIRCFCGRPTNVVVINWKLVFATYILRRLQHSAAAAADLIPFTAIFVVIVRMRFDRYSACANEITLLQYADTRVHIDRQTMFYYYTLSISAPFSENWNASKLYRGELTAASKSYLFTYF